MRTARKLTAGPLLLALAAAPAFAQSARDDALAWLAGEQRADGSFGQARVRDTSAAVIALSSSFGSAADLAHADAHLVAGVDDGECVDDLARTILALSARGDRHAATLAQHLLVRRNRDGGWGFAPGYPSAVLETSLALRALAAVGVRQASVVGPPLNWLLAAQGDDGGFSFGENASSLGLTAVALRALGAWRGVFNLTESMDAAVAFLLAAKASDGSFGHVETTLSDSALVQGALLSVGRADSATQAWLEDQQDSDGSFGGEAYATALIAELLEAAQPNVRIAPSGLSLSQTHPVAGEPVVLTVTVENPSAVPLTDVRVRVMRGHPSTGVQVGSDQLVTLTAGGVARVQLSLPTTGLLGPQPLYALADPLAALAEVLESDNVAEALVIVLLPAPDDVSARIDDGDVQLAWRDLSSAGAVAYNVYRDGALVGAGVSDPAFTDEGLPAGVTYVYTFAALAADGTEGRRSPGYAITLSEPPAGAELYLSGIDVTLGPNARVSFSAYNAGRTAVTNVRVLGMMRRVAAPAADILFDRVLTVLDGQGATALAESFSMPSEAGSYVLSLLIDPDDLVVELNDGNNRVDIPITLEPPPEPEPVQDAPAPPPPPPPPTDPGDVDGPLPEPAVTIPPEVFVRTADFSTDPVQLFEQTPFTLHGALSNRAGGPGENISVRLYNGDPRESGLLLGEALVPLLESDSVEIAFEDIVLDGGIHQLWIWGDADDIYAEGNEFNNFGSIFVEVDSLTPRLSLQDLILVSPAAAEKGTEITVSSTVVNRSNRDLTNITLTATVTEQSSGAVVASDSAAAFELAKRDVSLVELVRFTPAENGVYVIGLSAAGENPLDGPGFVEPVPVVNGSRELQIGPFVEGSVSVSPDEVAVGDPEVRATVELSARLGTIADEDPLVAAVVEAAQRGAGWSGNHAMNWNNGNRCFGCHVQTQALVSATLADDVFIPPSTTRMDSLFDAIAGYVNPNGTISNRAEVRTTTQLTVWALSFYDDITDPTNCARGEFCDGDSVCVPGCDADADCPTGSRCDLNGRCLEALPLCSADFECPAGNYCDGDGACVAACADDVDCASDEICSARGRCELARACLSDAVCAAGSFCGGDGVCTSGCALDADCQAGESCSASGRCLGATPTCGASADCATGSYCDAAGACVQACAIDDDCPAGRGCDPAGRCVVEGLCFTGARSNVELFRTVASYVVDNQHADGTWSNDHFDVSYRSVPSITQYAVTGMVRAVDLFPDDPRYEDAVSRTHAWLLSRSLTSYSDFDLGRILEGVNVLLAHYERQLDDERVAPLLDQRDALAEWLVARQAADGTWTDDATSFDQGPLITTAVVLYALASTGLFDRDDPTLRSGVLALLNAQQLDGSWGRLNGGDSNVDDTTMVMLAVPKIVEVLTSLDFEVEMELPDSITLKSSNRRGENLEVARGSLHRWDFPGLRDGFLTRLDVDLLLKGMEHEEERPIASRISLFYVNRATDTRVELPLAIPTVHATTEIAVDVDVPADSYTRGDEVPVDLAVSGISPGLLDPTTVVSIHDEDGAVVEVLRVLRHDQAELVGLEDFRWALPLAVVGGGSTSTDVVVELPLDLSAALADAGLSGAVDVGSLRVYEETQAGLVELPSSFLADPGFDSLLSATGRLRVLMAGETPAGGERRLRVVLYGADDVGAPAAPAAPGTAGRLVARFYNLDTDESVLSTPEGLVFQPAPVYVRALNQVRFNLGANGPGGGVSADWIGAEVSGFLYAPEPGSYLFEVSSDDGTWLNIDGARVVSRSGAGTTQGVAFLERGFHRFEAVWFDTTSTASFAVRWRAPSGAGLEEIPPSSLYARARGLQASVGAALEIEPPAGIVWSSGSAPAGSYIARARFTAGGAPVEIDEDPFVLLPSPQPQPGDPNALLANISPERGLYALHEDAVLFPRLRNPDLAYAYPALAADVVITAPGGDVVATLPRALSGLEPGSEQRWRREWSIGTAAAGVYTVELIATDADSGVELARATSAFTVVAPDVAATLAGNVTATPALVAAGQDVELASRVGNVGGEPWSDVPVTVVVRRLDDGAVVATYERVIASLAVGAVADASDAQPSATLEGGAYVVELRAAGVPLDHDFFEVVGEGTDAGPEVDAGPGAVTLVLPAGPVDLCAPEELLAYVEGGTPPYTFSADDTAVATVSSAVTPDGEPVGIITARAGGSVTVRVVDSLGASDEGTLQVPPPLTPVSTVLTAGERVVLGSIDVATPVARAVPGWRWHVDDEDVAVVDETGTLEGRSAGATRVRLIDEASGVEQTSRTLRVLPAGALEVTVVDETGAGVADVKVRLGAHTSVSDATGVARFEVAPTGSQVVWAWHAGIVATSIPLEIEAGETTTARLTVARSTGSITGRVIDEAGAAIAGARVSVVQAASRKAWTLVSDDEGRFAFGLAADEADARFFTFLQKDGYAPYVSLSRTLALGEHLDVTLQRLPLGAQADITAAGGGGAPMRRSAGCDPDRSRLVLAPFGAFSNEEQSLERELQVTVDDELYEDEPRTVTRGYRFELPEGTALPARTPVELQLRLLADRVATSAQDLRIERADALDGAFVEEPVELVHIEGDRVVFEATRLGAYRATLRPLVALPPAIPRETGFPRGGGCVCALGPQSQADALLWLALGGGLLVVTRRRREDRP